MVHLFLAILASHIGLWQTDHSLSLDEIARANSAAVSAIQSLNVESWDFTSTAGAPFVKISHIIYRTQGDKERMILDYLAVPPTEEGDKMGYSDVYNGPEGSKSIVGYDPSQPPQLGEITLSHAFGTLGPRSTGPSSTTSLPRLQLLLEIAFANNMWRLNELIASSTAKLVAIPSASPRRCFEIEVERPEVAFNISVDPAANFMIRRLEMTSSPRAHSKPMSTLEVETFQDCGDGIFLPTLINGQEYGAKGEIIKIRREFKIVSCNKPLSEDVLEPTFPDWLGVVDQRSGKIHCWGPDDKPRMTFDSAAEHQKWYQPRLTRALRARSAHRFSWWLVMGGVTAAIVLGVFLVRRARARHA